MAMARDALAAARVTLEAGHPARSVSDAYYAMLYAARAALSEDDRNAKTHSGTWTLFRETFVATGRFDAGLISRAQETQRQREAADYDARIVPAEQAAQIVDLAERFVQAIDELLG
jgi:uncharacterized protein (UPF0332 family)